MVLFQAKYSERSDKALKGMESSVTRATATLQYARVIDAELCSKSEYVATKLEGRAKQFLKTSDVVKVFPKFARIMAALDAKEKLRGTKNDQQLSSGFKFLFCYLSVGTDRIIVQAILTTTSIVQCFQVLYTTKTCLSMCFVDYKWCIIKIYI